MKFVTSACVVVLAGVTACSSGGTGTTDTGTKPPLCPTTFTNPIGNGADPWVIRSEGRYYSIESRDNGIVVYRSDTLTSLAKNGVKVWSPTSSGWNQTDIWAPELHLIDGRWYIYYAAGRPGPSGPDAAFTDQRSGVLESTGSDPQGPYV